MANKQDKSGMSKRSGATINNQTASQISDESKKEAANRKKNQKLDYIHRIHDDETKENDKPNRKK